PACIAAVSCADHCAEGSAFPHLIGPPSRRISSEPAASHKVPLRPIAALHSADTSRRRNPLSMIQLTRLNGCRLDVNCDLIKYAESSPDTVLTLVTGEKLVVLES